MHNYASQEKDLKYNGMPAFLLLVLSVWVPLEPRVPGARSSTL